jgi:short-subunit dehydrogenase
MSADLRSRYGGWALVTGASSGIGEAFAEALAARSFPLALVARRKERLEALAERLRAAHGVETLVVVQDLSEREACDHVAEAVGDREVGLLVSNAGFGFSGRFAEGDADADERMVAVNCSAVVGLAHRFLPPMLRRRRGGMVVVSSVAGCQPTPWFAVYGATKAFDLAFAEALWSELKGTGVDVIALAPGETRTEFAAKAHAKREFGGLEPRRVAEAALRAIGRRPSLVPGFVDKLAAASHRFFPRGFTANATGAVLARNLLLTTSDELRRRPYR